MEVSLSKTPPNPTCSPSQDQMPGSISTSISSIVPWTPRPGPGAWSCRRTSLRSPPASYSAGRQSHGKGGESHPRDPTHTHTHARTRAHADTHTHTHTHTHIECAVQDGPMGAQLAHTYGVGTIDDLDDVPSRGCCSAPSPEPRQSGCPSGDSPPGGALSAPCHAC